MDDEILSEKECAILVRVDVKTLSRARKRGEPIFPYVQVGDMAKYSRRVVLSKFADLPSSPAIKDPSLGNPTRRNIGRPRRVC